jgi:hypothetical protein
MPQTTMEHEDEFTLPKEQPLPAILTKVEEKSYPYTRDGKEQTFTKWVWEFDIVDGEFAGLRAWGETPPKLTNREDNKVRQWAETLRGEPFAMGEGLDTDLLLQLPCFILVDHVKEEKKGSKGEFYYKTPVVDVLPYDEALAEEPPF